MATKSEENFNKKLGFRLMTLRQRQKMSQESLGVYLGVRYQQVQKYELGVSRIPPEKLAICAKLFETSVEYLLGTYICMIIESYYLYKLALYFKINEKSYFY